MALATNGDALSGGAYLFKRAPIAHAISRVWNGPHAALIPMAGAYLIPAYPSIGLPVAGIILAASFANKMMPVRFPAFTPQSSNEKLDPNAPPPGKDVGSSPPKGITCIGYDRRTGMQVWLRADNDKRHHKTIATTGSGKTYGTLFRILMSLIQTTGMVVIDGKGDEDFPKEMWRLARRFGRELDIKFLNFKQAKDKYFNDHRELGDTFNPFLRATRSGVAEILKSLLSQDDDKAGKNDTWAQRANAFVDLLAALAVYLRDNFHEVLTVGTIREKLDFLALCRFYTDERIPTQFKAGLKAFFNTIPDMRVEDIPSYLEGAPFKGKVLEQYGYVSMQLQPALSVLADDYGHIFNTVNPSIDMVDIATKNRILFCLLPALQKSSTTTANTGKIVLAALKGMIASQLGEGLDGNIEVSKQSKVMADAAPFHVRLDESGYYAAINGIEVLPAQARGLGFSFEFIAQTYLDWVKAGGKVAEILWGNTNNTTIGKLEDDETFKKVNERMAEVTVLEQASINIESAFWGGMRRLLPNQLQMNKRAAFQISDFTKLKEGQFIYIFDDKAIELRVGSPDIGEASNELRANYGVGLPVLNDKERKNLQFDYAKLRQVVLTNLNQKNSRFNRRLKISSPSLTKILELGTNEMVSQKGALSIEQWQKLIYDIAAEKEAADKEDADQSTQAALDLIRKSKKNKPAKASAAKLPTSTALPATEEALQPSSETLSWFNNHSGTIDINTDNEPTTSAAVSSWESYQAQIDSDADKEVTQDSIDRFDDSFATEINDYHEQDSDFQKESIHDPISVSDDEDFNDIDETPISETAGIDEEIDRLGMPNFDDIDTGTDESGGAQLQLQMEFPGIGYSGQMGKPAPDYPPENMTTKSRGISDIVADNVNQIATIQDIEL